MLGISSSWIWQNLRYLVCKDFPIIYVDLKDKDLIIDSDTSVINGYLFKKKQFCILQIYSFSYYRIV